MNHVNDVDGVKVAFAAVSNKQKAAGHYTAIRKGHVARLSPKKVTEPKVHGGDAAQGAHGHQFTFWTTLTASRNVVGQHKHVQCIARRNDK